MVEIRMVHIDIHIKIIGEVVPGRCVRNASSVLIFGTKLMFRFVDIHSHIGNGGSIHYIRIRIQQTAAGSDHELTVHLIQINFCGTADGAGGLEALHSLFILFPVLHLLFNLFRSRFFTSFRREPGRQLFRAIITQIAAVGQFFPLQHTHFGAADRALFLAYQTVKESHV